MKHSLSILVFILLFNPLLKAQMVGPNGYLKATSVEVGIDGSGGFEGVDTMQSPPLPGMHMRSGTQFFGFVANPQLNGWAGSAYDGDFFTPGGPENGWGFEIGTTGGIIGSNNCANSGLDSVPGVLNWAHPFSCYTADWEGNYTRGTNLHFRISYRLQQTDLYYTTTISITNNTAAMIPEMYYYRNVDPDNNQTVFGTFSTDNTVVAEPTAGGCDIAHVSASQTSGSWVTYLGLAAVGNKWRATHGGFANRDASDIWNGVGLSQVIGSTVNEDLAISLAYRIDSLDPGETETFKFVTILADSAATNAINNLLYFNYPGSLTAPPAACTPFVDTARTCGAPVTIGVNGPIVSDYSWSWSPTAGLSTSSGSSVTASPGSTTTYTLTGTPLNSCVPPTSMSIVVQVTPAQGNNPYITPVPIQCTSNPPFNMTVDSAGGLWSGIGITNDTTGLFNPAVAGPGTHLIVYTTPGICNTTDTILVTVNSSGSPTITAPSTICDGASPVTLTSASSGGVWSGTGITDTLAGTFDPSVAGPGTYVISYTISGSCIAMDTATIVVGSITTPVTGFSYPTSPICVLDTTTNMLPVAGFTNGGTFTSSPFGLTLSSVSGAVTPTSSAPGTYTVTYSVPGTTCGPSGTSSTTVTINPLTPTNTGFSYSTPNVCKNNPDISPTGVAGFTTGGTYSSSSGLVINDSTGTISVSGSTPGTYTVTYSVAGNDTLCTAAGTGTTVVTVNPLPTIGLPADQVLWIGNSTTLIATGGVSYLWSPATDLSCTVCDTTVAHPTDSRTFCVTVTDSIGCVDSSCLKVSVEIPCPTNRNLEVPNAFTPNGDGYNDRLCLYGWDDCVNNFLIVIYDRWGEKVFSSTDPNFCWDGIYKGQLLDPGVFVYFIKAIFTSSGDTPLSATAKIEITKKGNISIVH